MNHVSEARLRFGLWGLHGRDVLSYGRGSWCESFGAKADGS